MTPPCEQCSELATRAVYHHWKGSTRAHVNHLCLTHAIALADELLQHGFEVSVYASWGKAVPSAVTLRCDLCPAPAVRMVLQQQATGDGKLAVSALCQRHLSVRLAALPEQDADFQVLVVALPSFEIVTE